MQPPPCTRSAHTAALTPTHPAPARAHARTPARPHARTPPPAHLHTQLMHARTHARTHAHARTMAACWWCSRVASPSTSMDRSQCPVCMSARPVRLQSVAARLRHSPHVRSSSATSRYSSARLRRAGKMRCGVIGKNRATLHARAHRNVPIVKESSPIWRAHPNKYKLRTPSMLASRCVGWIARAVTHLSKQRDSSGKMQTWLSSSGMAMCQAL